MLAITFSFPLHRRHVSMSIANTRSSRLAQVIARWRWASVLCGIEGLAPAFAFAITRSRSAMFGANTPWYRVR